MSGCALHAIAPTSLHNMNLSRWLLPIPLVTAPGNDDVAPSRTPSPPSAISHFCRFGSISSRTLFPTDPMASCMRHFMDMWTLSLAPARRALDSRTDPKKELRAEVRTVSGRSADLSNLPSMKYPFSSRRGFLIWLTRVDFLQ